MMDLYAAMRVFVRVVEAQSFSGVANELNVAQSTVSKQIGALEEHLGTRLMSRTTRALSLTSEGHEFYERSRDILGALTEAETTIGSRSASPHGLVRMGCPATFGRLLIAPRLVRLFACYPDLGLELVMNDALVDLVAEGLDLAVRIGRLADRTWIARRVGTAPRAVFGAPTYFSKRGWPTTPSQLREHNCIVFTHRGAAHGVHDWRFTGPAGRTNVHVRGNFLANNAEAIREAVLSGLGLAIAPIWMFHREMAADLVIRVLCDYQIEPLPIHLIYPSGRLVSAKVRAVSDFFADEFRSDPALVGGDAIENTPP